MKKIEKSLVKPNPISDNLFDRVVSILERARANVVRSVNTQIVGRRFATRLVMNLTDFLPQ